MINAAGVPAALGHRVGPHSNDYWTAPWETPIPRAAVSDLRAALRLHCRTLFAAREARAVRAVRRHTACHSDAVLRAAGYSHETIKKLRDMEEARYMRRRTSAKPTSIASLWIRLRGWLLARATVKTLSALDDRTLKDIGLSRAEIDEIAHQRAATSINPHQSSSDACN